MKRFFWLAMLLVATPAPAFAQPHWWQTGPTLPNLTGRVVDQADLLPPATEQRLTTLLQRLEQKSRHQFVIVTVTSLKGETIETFGVRLGRIWAIGRKNIDDGVLLIVAPNEHKVRIEVGYGLEKMLSDPECARIIANKIVPRFQAGDMAGGIEQGAQAIVANLSR